jgi:hypothetical protein
MHRILDVANDASVHEMQFGREVELDRHSMRKPWPGSKVFVQTTRSSAESSGSLEILHWPQSVS